MKVYLIYSRIDFSRGEITDAIADAMIHQDIGVWLDAPESEAKQRMHKWMQASDLIIVIWSANAISTDSVRTEWEIAQRTDRRIIAVKVGHVSTPEIPEHVYVLSVSKLKNVPDELAKFVKSISRFRIFISYSRKDKEIAKQLVSLIHRSPHEVWIDESGIDPGEGFPKKIIQSINRSDYFMLLWSRNSRESRWVEREWNYAFKESKKILPLLLDRTPLPMSLENINAFTSLDDDKLYQFLTVEKLLKKPNVLARLLSVIKQYLRNAA